MTGEDGKPVELGRGAMGVTYKAFDVDLRCQVTLKVISEKYLGAGAKLLRALGVRGDEAELRTASDEFSGHCLALTLLDSYLTDAYDGDIRFRKEVSERLAHDVRQGTHARR